MNTMIARDIIFLCAFRYALGRMTYIVSEVAAEIRKNAALLDDSTKRLIIAEITEAEVGGRLGMDMDAKVWLELRQVLEKYI